MPSPGKQDGTQARTEEDEVTPGGADAEAQGGNAAGDRATAVKDSARKATQTAKDSAAKAAARTKATTGKAAKAAKESATKAAGTVRAARAAKDGRVEDARAIATDADLEEGVATMAIAEVDALQYQVEVNKRGLSVSALTTTLNQRWENGWRLAHILEQRGNTVLVFEKRSPA